MKGGSVKSYFASDSLIRKSKEVEDWMGFIWGLDLILLSGEDSFG